MTEAPKGSRPDRPFLILSTISALLCLAGLALWVVYGGTDREDDGDGGFHPLPGAIPPAMDFAPFELADSEVLATWTLEMEGSGAPSAADEELLALWHAANFVAAMRARNLLVDEGSTAAETDQAYRESLRRWVSARGPEAYRRLGWTAWNRFDAALGALLDAATERGTTPRLVLENPVDPVSHAFFEAAGDFLDQGMRLGLLDPSGTPIVSRDVMVLVFRYRWLSAARDAFPIERLLPGPEYREFLRWRIEDARGITVEDRLRHIDDYVGRFGEFPTYPADFARAVAWFMVGNAAEAQTALERAIVVDPALSRFRGLFSP